MISSHWVLDFIVYLNLHLFFEGSPRIGLGFTTSELGLIAGILMEAALIAAGIAI